MLFEIGLPRKFAKLSKILWKFGSFGKEFRWTKFNAVEGVRVDSNILFSKCLFVFCAAVYLTIVLHLPFCHTKFLERRKFNMCSKLACCGPDSDSRDSAGTGTPCKRLRVPLSQAAPAYLITADYLYAFLLYLAR